MRSGLKLRGPSVPAEGSPRLHPENLPSSPLRPGQAFNPYKIFTGIFIPEALVRNPQISPGAKLAYGRLVRYAGKDGDCHPSVKALAREIGISERQAQRYVAELETHGLIRSVARFRAPRVRATNGYIFLWHESFIGTNRGPVSPVSDVAPPPVSFATSPRVSDVTPKESHLEDNREEKSQSSSKHENDDEHRTGYIEQIRKLLISRPSVKISFTAADAKLAASLWAKQVPLEQIERAVLLGCSRKHVGWCNGRVSGPITSLHYFSSLIEEVGYIRVGPDYWRYLEFRLKPLEARWLELQKRNACANLAEAGGEGP